MAIGKRRLWEEFINWASQFSRIGPDALGLKQISRQNLDIGAVIAFNYNATGVNDGSQTIVGGMKQIKDTEIIVSGFRGAGVYNLTWSVTGEIKTATTWFVACMPYLGKDTLSNIGDIIFTMAPWGVSYGANAAAPAPIPDPNAFMSNGDLAALSGHGVVVIDQDTPMYMGMLGATNRRGGFEITRASINLAKRRNM